jgi:hypothetical protein
MLQLLFALAACGPLLAVGRGLHTSSQGEIEAGDVVL